MKQLVTKFKDMYYYFILFYYLKDAESVLDVGCGANSPLGKVKKTFKSEGIDIFEPSIIASKKLGIHDLYKIGDIKKLSSYYKPKSFDIVIALDVIEHLKKNQALALIKEMEKIARKKVILLTPNGFHHQAHLDGNLHQEHLSGWTVADFQKNNYKTRGIRGLKNLRGEYASIKIKPWILWGTISFISEPLLYYFPKQSYHLFAFKNLPSSHQKKNNSH